MLKEEAMLEIEKEVKEENEQIERVLKEKGIDGLNVLERDLAERVFNYEPKTFDKELYKKLSYTEKREVYIKDTSLQKTYDDYVTSIRYDLRGEVFDPYQGTSVKTTQLVLETILDGTFFKYGLKHLLELEHELKQKYNKEGVK